MGCYLSCGGCGKKSLGFYVCAPDYSLNKNLALALVFSILHLVLPVTIITMYQARVMYSVISHMCCLSLIFLSVCMRLTLQNGA